MTKSLHVMTNKIFNSLITWCLIIEMFTNNNINLDYARLCKRDIFLPRDNDGIVYAYTDFNTAGLSLARGR